MAHLKVKNKKTVKLDKVHIQSFSLSRNLSADDSPYRLDIQTKHYGKVSDKKVYSGGNVAYNNNDVVALVKEMLQHVDGVDPEDIDDAYNDAFSNVDDMNTADKFVAMISLVGSVLGYVSKIDFDGVEQD